MLVVRWQASRLVYYWMPLRVRDVLIDSGYGVSGAFLFKLSEQIVRTGELGLEVES